MEAALTAAGRGHAVILCEKKRELGERLPVSGRCRLKTRLGEYLERQARWVREAGVEINLNTEVTTDLAERIARMRLLPPWARIP
jgi:NADPH-dependent 2,4-dienoyl-CoA reductase/sulfur reductase-like enzyme